VKRIVKTVILLALVLALLIPTAWAEPDAAVKGIYDALLAEGSDYSEAKAISAEYSPETKYDEKLEDDGFTITVSGTGYMDGSWRFTRDGDALTTTISNDGMESIVVIYVVKAVADYLGMNGSLTMGYVNGLSMLELSDDDFSMTPDEAAGTTNVRINIAGPWEMKELDQMVIDDRSLFYGALTEDSASMAANIGKVMMVANGSADDVTILLGEYGELDGVALQSLLNLVGILQPAGWEDFTANYTQLADAEAQGYAVRLNVDAQTVGAIIDDAPEGYSFAVVHFGA